MTLRISQRQTVQLPTGCLSVEVHRSDWPLDDLCGFASRYNPARGYLVVSKVLGKHYPARPSVMRRIHEQLAAKVHALHLNGPTGLIAMAETAVGLGHGVFDAYQAQDPSPDWLFLHTTRYALRHPVAFSLMEEHCHARDHLVYEPDSLEAKALLQSVNNLVLVDDELSTGKTMLNLSRAILERLPDVKRIVVVCIKCWLSEADRETLAATFSRPVEFVSLLDGSFQFTPGTLSPASMPTFKSEGDWQYKDEILPCNFGRLGLTAAEHQERIVPQASKIRESLRLDTSRPVVVLGTGEFLHAPYTLARLLEEEGFDVVFQSTTRTPVAPGHAIAGALRFADNYHENIDNFLYNPPESSDAQVLACYETTTLPKNHTLPRLLNAQPVFFSG